MGEVVEDASDQAEVAQAERESTCHWTWTV